MTANALRMHVHVHAKDLVDVIIMDADFRKSVENSHIITDDFYRSLVSDLVRWYSEKKTVAIPNSIKTIKWHPLVNNFQLAIGRALIKLVKIVSDIPDIPDIPDISDISDIKETYDESTPDFEDADFDNENENDLDEDDLYKAVATRDMLELEYILDYVFDGMEKCITYKHLSIALEGAVWLGYPEFAKMLINAGANTDRAYHYALTHFESTLGIYSETLEPLEPLDSAFIKHLPENMHLMHKLPFEDAFALAQYFQVENRWMNECISFALAEDWEPPANVNINMIRMELS
jgi:hypothetical protein